MRITERQVLEKKYKIIALDDEYGVIDTLSVFLKKFNYTLIGCTNSDEAIERIKKEEFDLMILDYMMYPINGDEVVNQIRMFNKDIYIILLTGHANLIPPLETIKKLDIQGYCEKSDKLEQLLLIIESALKSIQKIKALKNINIELEEAKEEIEQAYIELKYGNELENKSISDEVDKSNEILVEDFQEKYFSITNSNEINTIVYKINKISKDYFESAQMCAIERLEYSEEFVGIKKKRTFFVNSPEIDGTALLFLSFGNGKVTVNIGFLDYDKLIMSKRSIPMKFKIIYNEKETECKDLEYIQDIEKSRIIIDPEIAEEVKPAIYFDETINEVKGRFKLKPSKKYVDFEVREENKILLVEIKLVYSN